MSTIQIDSRRFDRERSMRTCHSLARQRAVVVRRVERASKVSGVRLLGARTPSASSSGKARGEWTAGCRSSSEDRPRGVRSVFWRCRCVAELLAAAAAFVVACGDSSGQQGRERAGGSDAPDAPEEQRDPDRNAAHDVDDEYDPPDPENVTAMPCATDLAAPEVLLAWTNLPNDDAAIASTTRIELGANNLLDVPVSLENVSAVGDAGGLPILSTLGDFVVEPSGSKIWSLDLGELGINPASMVFAGVLVVEAKIVVQDRARSAAPRARRSTFIL